VHAPAGHAEACHNVGKVGYKFAAEFLIRIEKDFDMGDAVDGKFIEGILQKLGVEACGGYAGLHNVAPFGRFCIV
jgi:hypothetical protein